MIYPADDPRRTNQEPDYSSNPVNVLADNAVFTLVDKSQTQSVNGVLRAKTFGMTYWQAKQLGWMPAGVSAVSGAYWANKLQRRFDQELDGGFGSGGGGGGGAAEEQYILPDEASVREQVKAYVVATTGTANAKLIDAATKTYLDGARKAFDQRETNQVDAWLLMQQKVRGSAEYQTIHSLRPESVDEMDWVVERQANLRALGLSANQAERLGVKQAQAGSNDEALLAAGEMQFNTDTGRMLRSQRETLKQSARAALRLV